MTVTIPLTIISFVLGLAIALAVALVRLSSNVVLSNVARFYISIIRGTPLLVQLFIVFFALPEFGMCFDPFPAAVIAFSLNVGGYAAEIIRSAILCVPKGQWEAAETIGLNYAGALRRIILPQATRVAVPPLSNTLISLVKDTSLASDDPGHRTAPAGPDRGGADVRVLRPVRDGGPLLLGDLPGAVVRAGPGRTPTGKVRGAMTDYRGRRSQGRREGVRGQQGAARGVVQGRRAGRRPPSSGRRVRARPHCCAP